MHEIARTAKSYRLNMPYGCISKYIFQGAPLIFVDLAEFFGVKIVIFFFMIALGYGDIVDIFFGGSTTELDYFGGYLGLFSG